MLKLNKYTVDELEELYDDLNFMVEHRIPEIFDKSATSDDRKSATFWVTNQYIDIAYTHYVLENFDQVKPYLEKAAPYAFLRGFDPDLKTHNNDWTIQQELNIVILFAEPDVIEKLSNSDWSLPKNNIINQACYLYDRLLMQIGTGQTPVQSDIDAALFEAKTTKNKDVLQYILPLTEAISALTSDNKALWQASIDKAIKWHSDECKFGDYKDMLEGFICLNALTMAKLGKDMLGWQCQTDSLYLPLFLID
ncbi:hypothetical protein C7Y70_08205 [Pseudoalteromonas sp. KS88]|uniref:Imm49 family immunity protein n=1 Tax=Pseudoalteromonas sp. KS88 TaxID=2109918 RepID=UPI001081AB44|nr:Imm49 family immunity protein [Pseudoalteromonas sp. KS88]TGE83956.1 hypothetical protein C7Y70_08205 [Pseudoalteromonas sp. KS88]